MRKCRLRKKTYIRKVKSYSAAFLAVSYLLTGFPSTVFAEEAVQKQGKHERADVFQVVLPVVTENVFDFIMDPQELIRKTDAAAYENRTFEEDATLFFKRSDEEADEDYSSSSDSLTIVNKGPMDVQVILTARISFDSIEGLRLSDSREFDGETEASLYLALADGENLVPINSEEGAVIEAVICGTSEEHRKNEEYEEYSFWLTGAVNAEGDWSELTDVVPKVTVTWEVSSMEDGEPEKENEMGENALEEGEPGENENEESKSDENESAENEEGLGESDKTVNESEETQGENGQEQQGENSQEQGDDTQKENPDKPQEGENPGEQSGAEDLKGDKTAAGVSDPEGSRPGHHMGQDAAAGKDEEEENHASEDSASEKDSSTDEPGKINQSGADEPGSMNENDTGDSGSTDDSSTNKSDNAGKNSTDEPGSEDKDSMNDSGVADKSGSTDGDSTGEKISAADNDHTESDGSSDRTDTGKNESSAAEKQGNIKENNKNTTENHVSEEKQEREKSIEVKTGETASREVSDKEDKSSEENDAGREAEKET